MEWLILIVIIAAASYLINRRVKGRRNRRIARHHASSSLPRRISDWQGRDPKLRNWPPLPPRRGGVVLGPRGIKPSQFPCCPIDKERNEEGEPQQIFWDPAAQCYHCSHGHRFGRNGKIIIS